MSPTPQLPAGLVAFVKRECPTCTMVAPVLARLAKETALTVVSQDDPQFPSGTKIVDDRSLELSWHHAIDAVPTLLRIENGAVTGKAIGWNRGEWESVTGLRGLGPELPENRPGCGSLSVDPDRQADLLVRFGGSKLRSRRVEVAALEDEHEALYARGWTDGLPVVPPTERRVMAMLEGTTRKPDEIVAVVPPDLVECSVEKVAVNA
ncbi:MAG: thioredoxin family protein, partial [Candidatus Binatia bacterium]